MNEADQAQRETAQAAGQVVGLAADLVGAAADAFRRTEQRQKGKGQDPSISSLDEGQAPVTDKGVILESEEKQFSKDELFETFASESGITELKGLTYEETKTISPEIAEVFDKVQPDVEKNEKLRSLSPTTEPNRESAVRIYDAKWDVRDILDNQPELRASLQSRNQSQDLSQSPAIPSLDDGDRDLAVKAEKNGVDAVLEKIDNAPAPIPEKVQEKLDNPPAYRANLENQSSDKKEATETRQSESSFQGSEQQSEQLSSEVHVDESQYRDSLKSQGISDEIIDGAIAEIKHSGESLESQEPKNTQQGEKQSVQPPQEKTPKVDGVGSVGQQTTQKVAQPKPTASGPRQAKSEVKALGKSLETELKGILKANKVEARIYSGSQLVYPPKANTKISPEVSDKLNRAFSDPQSVKGTVTLSLRTEDGKLNPVYKVSNGKVVKDDYGLRKAIAQSLPESQKVDQPQQKTEAKVVQQPDAKPEQKATQKAEAKVEPQQSKESVEKKAEEKADQKPDSKAEQKATQKTEQKVEAQVEPQQSKESVEQKPEPKADQQPDSKVEQKASLQAEQAASRQSEASSIERQNSINQSSTAPRVRRPTSDEVIGRQAQRIQDQQREIQTLKEQLQNSQKLEAQLRKAKVPIGLITGIQNHANRLSNQIKNRVNSAKAKTAEKVRGAVDTVDKKLMRMETATVYRASSYLAKAHGKEQADGSRQFTVDHRFQINLKKDGNLTISRANEDKATIFSGNQKESRFSKSATMNELNKVKSLPMAVGKIRHEQQKALQTQKQAIRQQNSKGVSRRR